MIRLSTDIETVIISNVKAKQIVDIPDHKLPYFNLLTDKEQAEYFIENGKTIIEDFTADNIQIDTSSILNIRKTKLA